MNNTTIVGAVEIGTAKVVALVGEVVLGQALNIIGMGQVASEGVKKGEIIDFKLASNCVHEALKHAEESAACPIEYTYLAHTGSHLRGYLNTGVVNVSASNGVVSRLDIKSVQENAKNKQLPPDYVYIHHIRNAYKLDGRIVNDPYMLAGERLELSYWSIHTDFNAIKDAIHIINGFSLKVEGVVASSIASGSIVANNIEKKNGVLVIDIGCGTTDYVIYKGGYVVKTGVIPVGGDHVSNDLSLGLRVDLKNAESIKQNANLNPETTDPITIHTSGTEQKIAQEIVYKIIHARVEELLQIIAKQIEPYLSQGVLGNVVLTGGSSRLKGLNKLIKEIMGLECRLANNPSWASSSLKEPEYSTVLGLLHHALQDQSAHNTDSCVQNTSLLGKVAKLFT